ncbi:MAG TPA: radical SAM protein [Flavobacteriales bacterium]|nr:radical SAM protein [Flavobacteriales bacterium]
MARVLLSHSYFYYFDPKQWRAKRPYPPLGTLYAASVLRDQGHEVIFFDNALEKNTGAFARILKTSKPDVLVLYDDGFNYLTKMCLTNMREASFEMTSMANRLGIPVVVSSSDSTDQHKMYLDQGVDFVILGEGEITLKELIHSLSAKEVDVSSISGLVFKKGAEMIRTKPRTELRNLDELPFPAWDILDVNRYKDIWMKNHGYFSLNISTTRGCPFKCNWCAKPIYGNRYNSRSPQKVAQEMTMLTEQFQVDRFWITDDIFGLKPNWVHEFAAEVERTNQHFKYVIQSRVDLMLKDDNLKSMIRSGLHEVWVGAESGSQKILDAMDKGITVDQIREATRIVHSYNRRICFFLQLGYPGEEQDDIQKTIDLLLELMPDDIGVSVSYPLPGTVFYERVKNELALKSNWTDSDDLDLMYSGSFDSEYYKKIHRVIHKLYRRKQGLRYLNSPLIKWKKYRMTELRSIALSLFYYTPIVVFGGLHKKQIHNPG